MLNRNWVFVLLFSDTILSLLIKNNNNDNNNNNNNNNNIIAWSVYSEEILLDDYMTITW